MQADGRTVTLELRAAVNPGVTNHLKLAIADTGDDILNSWVFIKGRQLRRHRELHERHRR
jgi:hypothetical protein